MKKANPVDKKSIKRKKLYDAAYDLFVEKGIRETVIDDIVKKAGVAKGTFYLYFKDKYDLIDKIILRKSSVIIENAMRAAEEQRVLGGMDFREGVILFIDYLLDYFKHNKELLTIIYKNLSRGLYREAITSKEMVEAARKFTDNFKDKNGDTDKAQKTLYIIVEMVSSVCYNAIVLEEPYKIDEIKPMLYMAVRKIMD